MGSASRLLSGVILLSLGLGLSSCSPSQPAGSSSSAAGSPVESITGAGSSGEADASTEVDAGSGTGAPELSAPSGEAAGVTGMLERRIGFGRAVDAVSAGRTTVVVTTVGVEVLMADGQIVTLPVGPARDDRWVALSPDGAEVLVGAPGVEGQWWELGELPRLIRHLPEASDAAFLGDGRVVLVGPSGVQVSGVDDGVAPDSVVPPVDDDGRSIVAVSLDRSTGWTVAVVAGDDGFEVVAGRPGESMERQLLDLDHMSMVEEVRARPGGNGAVLDVVGENMFLDRSLVGWDAGLRWEVPIDEEMWAVGPGGEVLVVGAAGARTIGPDGRAGPVVDLSIAARVVSVHPLGESGFLTLLSDGVWIIHGPGGVVRSHSPGTGSAMVSARPSADGGFTLVDSLGRLVTVDGDGDGDGDGGFATERYVAGFVNDIDLFDDEVLAVATSAGSVLVVPVGPGSDTGSSSSTGTGSDDDHRSVLDHPEGNVDAVAFSPDGQTIVTGVAQRRDATAFDDSLIAWDRVDGGRLWKHGGEAEDVAGCSSFGNRVELAVGGTLAVGLSHDYSVEVVDPGTGERVRAIEAHRAPIVGLALSADGSTLATSAEDATLRLWDVASGERLVDRAAPVGGFRSVVFVGDGSTLVGVDSRGQVLLVDAGSGEIVSQFTGEASPNAEAAVSPDGRLLAVGDGSTLRLWSIETGLPVGQLDGHSGLVRTAAFTSDGTRLISGASDGTVVVWHLASH